MRRPTWQTIPSWLRPRLLLSAALAGFLLCVVAGHVVSRVDPGFDDFVRMHLYLEATTQYYPTARQMMATTLRQEKRPDSIFVIIGGSSILWGTGQRPDTLWSVRLQSLLGDRYTVVNLALTGGSIIDNAGVIAAMLLKSGHKVIVVADEQPDRVEAVRYGSHRAYVYWDALYKGYIPEDPAYLAHVAEADRALTASAAATEREMRLGLWLDGWLRFRDLWSVIGYRHLFTIWHHQAAERGFFMTPRRLFTDPTIGDHESPVEERYPRDAWERETRLFVQPIARFGCTAGDPAVARATTRELEARLPAEVRRRTLAVELFASPFYVRGLLSPADQECYRFLYRRADDWYRQTGHTPLVIDDFSSEDYGDRVHLVGQGAAKLAGRVAPAVRELAHRLGYEP